MLKDVIQEYDEYFPEIIERASYALEKVNGSLGGWAHWGSHEWNKDVQWPFGGGTC
jgi:hypothetical protein